MRKLEKIRTHLRENLTVSRYNHCRNVEKAAVELAEKFNINTYRCALAGLAHDICREFSPDRLEKITGKIHRFPILLHGEAGAVLLKERFSIDDPSILDAVKYHTSGRKGLDEIGKIIFAADYLEEGREHLSSNEREQLFSMELDDMVLHIAIDTRDYLERLRLPVEEELYELIEELR